MVSGEEGDVGFLTDGRDDAVGFYDELGPLYGDRSSATTGIRLSQPHTDALHSGNLAIGAENPHRSSQVVDFHPFEFSRLNFCFVSGHLFARPPINDEDLLTAYPQRGAGRIYGGIPTADDNYPLYRVDLLAQVDLAEEGDAVHKALILVFPGYAELQSLVGTYGHEDGFIPLLLEGINS